MTAATPDYPCCAHCGSERLADAGMMHPRPCEHGCHAIPPPRECPEHRGALAACEPIHEARYHAEMNGPASTTELWGDWPRRMADAPPEVPPRSTWHGEPYDHSGAFDALGGVVSDADPGL